MKKQYFFLIMLWLTAIAGTLHAQDTTGNESPIIFDIEPDWIGATLIFGFKDLGFFPEVDTIFTVGLGGKLRLVRLLPYTCRRTLLRFSCRF